MTSTFRRRSAFTLIELLMVVMMISILFSILLSAIRTVERHTLQSVTRAEIKMIENAWKQYYAHYQMWPTNNTTQTVEGRPLEYLLDEALARTLSGDKNAELNSDSIIFMEFSRYEKLNSSSGQQEMPINPWSESGRHQTTDCLYYVKFDEDGVNEIEVPADGVTTKTKLNRGVIVWSFNPAVRDRSGNLKLLGSWQ